MPGGGGSIVIEIPTGPGFLQEGKGPSGREGVCGELGNGGGGGALNIFFRGRNVHQVILERKKPIKKNQIKEFGGRMPRRRPTDKLGTSQGHLGHLGLIYV